MIIPRPLKKVLGKIIPFSQEDKIPTFNLGSGTADYTTYLRGDGVWSTVGSGSGSVPDSRTITIDGVSQDLSADRTWNVIPSGGTTGQILAKLDDTSYNLEWIENFANYTSTLKHEVKAGEAMTKGQAVYVSSADGTNMIVSKASNATEATSSKTMGLIAQNLAHNEKGFVITEGLLSGLNTASATAGDPVWLGTGGDLIYGLINKPAAPAHLVFIGIVTRANISNGEIFIRVQNGFELQELHNVAIATPTNGQVLQYESATSLWKNATPSSGALTVGTTAIASGTIGRILFQNGGDVLGQDSALFWDNTNKRLGIGATPASTVRLDVRAAGALSTDIALRIRNSADSQNLFSIAGDGRFTIGLNALLNGTTDVFKNVVIGGGAKDISASGVSESSVAIGYNAVSNNGGTAIGANTTIVAVSGVAVGASAYAGWDSTALGSGARADGTSGYQSLAIGKGARASALLSGIIAVGQSSYTNALGQTLAFCVDPSGANSQTMLLTNKANLVFRNSTQLTAGTHWNTTATNTLTIHNGVIPNGTIANAGQLYVEGGALKFRGGSGTITTIAIA